jgi:N-acetyl sugar amidotransferase
MIQEILHWGDHKFIPRDYQMCTKTVMDNIADPQITFDEKGICNYYYDYIEKEKKEVYSGENGLDKLNGAISQLKTEGKGRDYDCTLGISGGVDSTFLAHLLKTNNIRVLLVHFDYGWNSELAVKNIENIVAKTGFDLETVVMDWEEFKDLQRSYFKASVLDLDIPADHMIFGALYRVANKYNIKSIVSGHNIVTEYLLPNSWYYKKFDLTNLKNIQSKFGTLPLKNLKSLGHLHLSYYVSFKKIKMMKILNYIEYNKSDVKQLIKDKLDWKDYGGKHYESVFTRFYQGYILPKKFGIDKRKAHLSNLICSGQINREEAIQELSSPPMPKKLMEEDKSYVAKKLGFSKSEFEEVLSLKNVPHEHYGTDENQIKKFQALLKIAKPFTSLLIK